MYRQALEYLREWKTRRTRRPLVVRGARQVGKSHLVRMFAEAEFGNLEELKSSYTMESERIIHKRAEENSSYNPDLIETTLPDDDDESLELF